ncbi:DUF167 domain-containing protein [Luteococcus peritonei]|uniref:UPF0235 protein ACFSCS_02170 n=1 Tax=Luteococcus peritonei TaxID=88874 RepID=A0ABW4RT39_9ACTN
MRRPIRVKPGASRTHVGGMHDPQGEPALVVQVNAPAVDGRANKAVLAALAKALGTRPNRLEIVSGQTSRTKLVEFDDELAPAWQDLLQG